MTQQDGKLDIPRWSKLDNGYKFLYIFTSITFLTIIFTNIIYFNLISNTFFAIGFSIIIAGVIVVIVVDRLEKKNGI